MEIIYVDPRIVVVEKPGGLLAVPGRGPDNQDCVASQVKKLFPECIFQPAVHRLDLHTSGLMVLARTKAAHRHLSMQFENRSVKKHYIAIVDGIVTQESGEIRLSFRLDPDNRPYQVYDPVHGKPGVSRWRKIALEGSNTRIEFTPITGRTHQLRLHASHEQGLGCPIVGDQLYGTGQEGDQLLLHATNLEFLHPETGRTMVFESKPLF